MGYQAVKTLYGSNLNQKFFFLDSGAQDLPDPMNTAISYPGSVAWAPTTGEKWFLTNDRRWEELNFPSSLMIISELLKEENGYY